MLTDLFVHLNAEAGAGSRRKAEAIGHTVAVQIKSTRKPFTLSKKELRLVARSAIPWFLAVCDKAGSSLHVYSTLDRLFYQKYDKGVRITFDQRPEDLETFKAASCLQVGPPIASVRLADLEQADVRKRRAVCDNFRKVLYSFAWWEAVSIAELRTSVSWVSRPMCVTTNQTLDGRTLKAFQVPSLVNPNGLARGATMRLMALRRVLDGQNANAVDVKVIADLRGAAEAVLNQLSPRDTRP